MCEFRLIVPFLSVLQFIPGKKCLNVAYNYVTISVLLVLCMVDCNFNLIWVPEVFFFVFFFSSWTLWILCSVCTGAFDQHGCHLIVFPVDGQARLSSELSKADVVDFINYFLCLHKCVVSHRLNVYMGMCGVGVLYKIHWLLDCPLHSKKQEKESLASVVADLRHASLSTTRFISETLLLLEVMS